MLDNAYNNLTSLSRFRNPPKVYLIFTKDQRIPMIVEDTVKSLFGVTNEAHKTFTDKQFNNLMYLKGSIPYYDNFWLVSMQVTEELTTRNIKIIQEADNAILIMHTNDFKIYVKTGEALDRARLKVAMFGLNYVNRQFAYNLIKHYGVEECFSTKMTHYLSRHYGSDLKDVMDLLQRLSVHPEKVTQKYLRDELGIGRVGLETVAQLFITYKDNYNAEKNIIRKIKYKNTVQKIYGTAKTYSESYSYSSFQTEVDKFFEAVIVHKSEQIKGQHAELRRRIKANDEELSSQIRRVDWFFDDVKHYTLRHFIEVRSLFNSITLENEKDLMQLIALFGKMVEQEIKPSFDDKEN